MFKKTIHRTIGTFALAAALSATAPAPAGTQYTISGDFSEGCFGMCLCIIMHFGELEGSFRLVEYELHSVAPDPVQQYQLIDVDLSIVSGTIGLRHYTGIGTYTIVNGIIVTHQLTLDLVDDKGAELHLDSGMIPGGEQFPDISVPIQHVLSPDCYGSWYDVDAVPVPHIPADLNGDGVVNSLDLGILLSQWTITSGILCGPACCPADLNGDCVVDTLDLGILLSSWTL